jgi:hypothetical protein
MEIMENPEKIRGIVLEIDPETKRFIKTCAVIMGMSMKELVLTSVMEYIKKENPKFVSEENIKNIKKLEGMKDEH